MGRLTRKIWRKGLKRSVKAISPVISSVVLTETIVALLFVTLAFANDFLTARLAENEFAAMKQFMRNVALQIDNVAWIIGRTQTIRFSSRYGHLDFVEAAITYAITIKKSDGTTECIATNVIGMLVFNMPVDKYSLGNDYFELVFPSENSFVFNGTSAPVARVFVSEKIPMADGNYIRVAVVPCIRMLRSTINSGNTTSFRYKLHLPILRAGQFLHKSQTITLISQYVASSTKTDVVGFNVTISFPSSPKGFDLEFFHFNSSQFSVNFPKASLLEVYVSNVTLSLGVHS